LTDGNNLRGAAPIIALRCVALADLILVTVRWFRTAAHEQPLALTGEDSRHSEPGAGTGSEQHTGGRPELRHTNSLTRDREASIKK
jgi:hypothetical protein